MINEPDVCKKCGSVELKKNGKRYNSSGETIGQFYRCNDCDSRFLVNFEEVIVTDLGSKNSTHIEEELKDNEKIITFTGTKIPMTEKEVIEMYKIDLDIWTIEKLKFNQWGQEDKPNKQSTVILRKIIPDNPKCPVLKKIEMPKFGIQPRDWSKKDIKKTIVACDSHIGFRRNLLSNKLEPFHDRQALDLFLNLCDYIQPDELILAGDMLDISEGSQKFLKEPEFYFTTQSALIEFGYILQKLRKSLPKTKIVYMIGNHEERLRKFALDNMAFAYTLKQPGTDMSILSLRNLLDLDSLCIDFIEDYPKGNYWINSKLRVIHGQVTKLESELSKSKISTIMGHTHKTSRKFKTSHGRDGIEKMFVETIGVLSKIDGTVPGDAEPDWQQSILLVNTVGDKYFDTHAIVFHSGNTIYNDILFSGSDYTKEIESHFKNLL